MNVKRIISSLLLILLLLYPSVIHAQVPERDIGTPGGGSIQQDNRTQYFDPGRDPFALRPELLRFFGGQEAVESTGSLFTGDDMKYNGLFTTPTRQLGGARPFTNPVVTNEDEVKPGGPTFIVITSEYTPDSNLTSDSEITLKVTLRNVGENLAEGVTFYACLQDDYITLLEEPAPEPPFTNDPMSTIEESDEDTGPPPDVPIEPESPDALPDDEDAEDSEEEPPASGIQDPTLNDCFMRLEWDSIDGEPIDLEPGEEVTFSWSFKPKMNDLIIRWRLVAEYGSGASYLRHWIPVKNPNPTGSGAIQGPGIPSVCAQSGTTEPFPEAASTEEIFAAFKSKWDIEFVNLDYDWGSQQYRPYLKGFWEAISAVECSSFLQNVIKDGPLRLIASSQPDFWGWQKDTNEIHYNLANMLRDGAGTGAPAQFHQFAIHELGHVFMSKNYDVYAEFESSVCKTPEPHAGISTYGSGSCSEDFAEAIGYYAIRDSKEQGVGEERCPAKNPYDWGWPSYYEFMKTKVFGNVEFGAPAPATPTSC